MLWVWPISTKYLDFSDNNFGRGTKACMQMGDRKLS